MSPVLTLQVVETLESARRAGVASLICSLDLQLSTTTVELAQEHWEWQGQRYAYPPNLKDRTIYFWNDGSFEPAVRFTTSLIKLIPTPWGAPTFEIDGIKMLPTARISPYADAERKVALIQPRGKVVLDTCGGLGYFAAWCVRGKASKVLSFEKNPAVVWLRGINPWSPPNDSTLVLALADVTEQIATLSSLSVDAVLHDPPRFGIAGDLYSQGFYDQLARVLKRRGRLFHYTGSPNKNSSGRDLAGEVVRRLGVAGFSAEREGDGVLARKLS